MLKTKSDYFDDIVSDLHPSYGEVLSMTLCHKTAASNEALNYILHLWGDKDVTKHPQARMIHGLAIAAERDDILELFSEV